MTTRRKRCIRKVARSITQSAAWGFGITLMIVGAIQGIVQAATGNIPPAVVPVAPTPILARPEVLFGLGLVATLIGVLLKMDRDSTRHTIHQNHADLKEWMEKIDSKSHTTAETLASLEGACKARRGAGEC